MTDPERTATSPPAASLVGDTHVHAGDRPTASGDAVRGIEDLLTRGPNDTAPAAPPASDAPPGFVIERELGAGAMGAVYLSRQVGLNRLCALKLVKAADPKALIRFLAEAEAVAAVRHPNVVEVFQYGDHRGRPYLALEFCPGGDLTTLTRAEQTRDAAWFRRVTELMAGVADGVNAAHVAGIVHRDLKPHNVLLAADGTPKLADFGLAKKGVGSDLTQTDAVMGTPAYMAPEQAGGGTKFVGPEADVWALGVILYELSCGERPIQLDSAVPLRDALARIINAEVTPLRSKCPAVPTDLALIAHKCLSKDPRDRYTTAGGLATDLRNWLDGKPISARPAGVVEQAVKWAKRNKKLAVMGAAVLLTMAAATGVSLGFGLDANEQRNRADKKQKDAEEAAEREAKEKTDAISARTETQRTLARALLAPTSSDYGISSPRLNEYEQETLWKLAELRDGPVGLMLLEDAVASQLAARQLRTRAEVLVHAAVGMDVRKWANAELLTAHCLRNPKVALDCKRDVAFAVARAGMHEPAVEAADTLVLALGQETNDGKREWLAEGVAELSDRLAADKAAEVCGRVADELTAALDTKTEASNRFALAKGLSTVAPWLPVEKATVVLAIARGKVADEYGRRQLAKGLSATTARLPANQAINVLLSTMDKATDAGEIQELAAGLAAAVGRLPAYDAAEALLSCLDRTTKTRQQRELAVCLATVAAGLPAGKAEKQYARATEILVASLRSEFFPWERQVLLRSVATLAERLPVDKATEVCETLAQELLAAPRIADGRADRRELAGGLATVTTALPADKAEKVCAPVTDALLTALKSERDEQQQRDLAVCLAMVASRLPAGKAEKVCGMAAEVLSTALTKATVWYERTYLAEGLAAVAAALPGRKGEKVCAPVATLLVADFTVATDRQQRRMLAKGLAVLAGQMSEAQAAQVCASVVDLLTADLIKAGLHEQGDLTDTLMAVAARLPVGQRERVCNAVADGLLSRQDRAKNGTERRQMGQGLAAVARQLPVDSAADLLITALNRATDTDENRTLSKCLAEVAVRLPKDRATEVRAMAAKLLLVARVREYEEGIRGALADGFLAVVGSDRANVLKRQLHSTVIAALAGGVTFHPGALPKLDLLPPESLVELLKHPFCVKEARRAVLDALEFTYNRKFADLWDFVAFAEKEHPELDLLTPPRRPERK